MKILVKENPWKSKRSGDQLGLENCRRKNLSNISEFSCLSSTITEEKESDVIFISFFRYVQADDAGKYECQVSTEPKLSHFLHLSVIGEFFKKIIILKYEIAHK